MKICRYTNERVQNDIVQKLYFSFKTACRLSHNEPYSKILEKKYTMAIKAACKLCVKIS